MDFAGLRCVAGHSVPVPVVLAQVQIFEPGNNKAVLFPWTAVYVAHSRIAFGPFHAGFSHIAACEGKRI